MGQGLFVRVPLDQDEHGQIADALPLTEGVVGDNPYVRRFIVRQESEFRGKIRDLFAEAMQG